MAGPSTYTVLVPLDGSPAAESTLGLAAGLAGQTGHVMLLTVTPEPEPVRNLIGQTVLSVDESEELAHKHAQEYLSALVADSDLDPARTLTRVATGDPSESILDIASTEHVDLICMATSGRGAAGRVLFGSVADRVARHGAVPTLLVRSHGVHEQLSQVVVPLDGSKLSEAAIPVAVDIAERLRLPIRLIRIVDTDDVVRHMNTDGEVDLFVLPPDHDYHKARLEVETRERDRLTEIAARLIPADRPVNIHVESGSAAFLLLERVHASDLTVLTSHGRSGVRRWLLGSVAEKLVRHAAGPVVVVRPESSG